jgi:hypothetical protein
MHALTFTRASILPLALALGCADDSQPSDDEVGDTGSTDTTDGSTDDTGSSTTDETSTTDDDTGTTDDTSTTDDTTDDTTDETTETGDPPEFFEVGVDIRSIDPTQAELQGLYLGGFGAPFLRGQAQGVHDSLYARTFAIGYGDDAIIYTVVDAVGMGNHWTREIRMKAALATGISAQRIVIATTHSHSGPDFQGLWGGVGNAYKAKVIDAVVASMQAAWDGREPADLSASNSIGDNNNRRDWGYTDDTALVLQAHAQDDDALLGTMVSFAAHPVVLGDGNKQLSRDYVGYAVDALEFGTGGPVVWFNGILGDVSPKTPPGDYADDFARAQAYGELLAMQAVAMVDSAEPVDLGMAHAFEQWELPVDNTLFNLAGQLGILDYDFDMRGMQNIVTTQAVYIRLGTKVQLVAFPGESLTRNGLPIKEVMPAPYKAVLGNAGDALGYFVPSDEWQIGLNDNYEEGVSLGMSVGDTTRDIIIEMITADPF